MKYWSKNDADYLYNSMGANFRHTANKEGSNYYGLNLKWNYTLGYIDTSVPKYISKTLKCLNQY